jgi:hypothetical protein
MWRGFPQEYAEERAMRIASREAPGLVAVVRGCHLAGIEWQVRLWLFDPHLKDPREAVARLRATDGEPVSFETSA